MSTKLKEEAFAAENAMKAYGKDRQETYITGYGIKRLNYKLSDDSKKAVAEATLAKCADNLKKIKGRVIIGAILSFIFFFEIIMTIIRNIVALVESRRQFVENSSSVQTIKAAKNTVFGLAIIIFLIALIVLVVSIIIGSSVAKTTGLYKGAKILKKEIRFSNIGINGYETMIIFARFATAIYCFIKFIWKCIVTPFKCIATANNPLAKATGKINSKCKLILPKEALASWANFTDDAVYAAAQNSLTSTNESESAQETVQGSDVSYEASTAQPNATTPTAKQNIDMKNMKISIGTYADAAKSALDIFGGDWHEAGLTSRGTKQLTKSLSSSARKIIAAATSFKWLSQLKQCLLFTIIAAVCLLSAIIAFIVGGATSSSSGTTFGVIFIIGYLVLSFFIQKTTLLYNGSQSMDISHGLGGSGIEIKSNVSALIICAKILSLPFNAVKFVVNYMIMMLKIAFGGSGDSIALYVGRAGMESKVLLPAGVDSSFDELINNERYFALSNSLERIKGGFGEFLAEEEKRHILSEIQDLERSEKEVHEAYRDENVSQEEYDKMVEVHNEKAKDFIRDHGDKLE